MFDAHKKLSNALGHYKHPVFARYMEKGWVCLLAE